MPTTFKGSVIGVEAGTNFSAFLDARFKQNVQIKAFDKFDNALADLVSGRVDYVQEGKGLFTAFLASRDGKDFEVKATCADDPVLGLGVGAGVRRGDAARQAVDRDRATAAGRHVGCDYRPLSEPERHDREGALSAWPRTIRCSRCSHSATAVMAACSRVRSR